MVFLGWDSPSGRGAAARRPDGVVPTKKNHGQIDLWPPTGPARPGVYIYIFRLRILSGLIQVEVLESSFESINHGNVQFLFEEQRGSAVARFLKPAGPQTRGGATPHSGAFPACGKKIPAGPGEREGLGTHGVWGAEAPER